MSNETQAEPPRPSAVTPISGNDTTTRDIRAARRAARLEARPEGASLPQGLLEQLPVLRNRPGPVAGRRIEQRLTVTHLRQVPPAEVVEAEAIPIPGRIEPRRKYAEITWFGLAVVLPVVAATIYYAFFAASQYVAEFRYAVKEAQVQSAGAATSSILSMLGSSGGAATYDNYLVADYLTSRQAAEELQNRINVTQLYARPEADWWTRFDASQPMEKFVRYWQGMVTSRYDQVTGIATAQVRAFTPEDALLIANSLVTLSEELVNKIANRSQTDAVRFAAREVERAEERLKAVRAKLTEYRNRVGVIDPASSVVASNSTLVQGLRSNLTQLETQMQTLRLQNLQPNAPIMISLQNQINSTKEQLATVENSVGRNTRTGAPLSSVIAEYEQLDLERQFAQNMVTGAMAALDQARASANSQHLYITPYVRPSLPQSSLYPRPLWAIAAVAGLALIVWLIGLLAGRSIFERMS